MALSAPSGQKQRASWRIYLLFTLACGRAEMIHTTGRQKSEPKSPRQMIGFALWQRLGRFFISAIRAKRLLHTNRSSLLRAIAMIQPLRPQGDFERLSPFLCISSVGKKIKETKSDWGATSAVCTISFPVPDWGERRRKRRTGMKVRHLGI